MNHGRLDLRAWGLLPDLSKCDTFFPLTDQLPVTFPSLVAKPSGDRAISMSSKLGQESATAQILNRRLRRNHRNNPGQQRRKKKGHEKPTLVGHCTAETTQVTNHSEVFTGKAAVLMSHSR